MRPDSSTSSIRRLCRNISYGQSGCKQLGSVLRNFAKELSEKEGILLHLSIQMATTTKLNIDKATVRQLFKAVIKTTDDINEKSILYGQAKRVLPIKPLAQAAEFYVPNGNQDRIALTTNGHPDIRAWSDRELVNTKPG